MVESDGGGGERERTNRLAGGLMCVTFGGGRLIGTHQALFKDFSPEGELVHHRTHTHTTCATGGGLGGG